MTKTQLAYAAALLMACAGASAQVFKCRAPNGHTTYSDAPCATGTAGQKVERHYTLDEIQRERQVAAGAEARKQARERAEMLEQWEAQQRALAAQAVAPQPSGSDWQRRKDAENAATSARSITNSGGAWDRQAAAARAQQRRHQVEEPMPAAESQQANRRIHHCTGDVCDDWSGNRYNRGDFGNYQSSDGRSCAMVADSMRC